MDKDISEQNNLVTYWRNKLNWYMQEATDEEYDEEEILAIKSILDIMECEKLNESYYNPEKGFERFTETLDIRMKIQDEMQRTKDKVAARKCFVFTTNGFRKVAMVASLVVALFIGGTAGAYAQKEGFFQLSDKDGGKEVIATPSFDMTANTGNNYLFNKIEEIPHEYLEFMWIPSDLPSEMQFHTASISSYESYVRMVSGYGFDDDFFNIEQKVFKNNVTYLDALFDGYVLLEKHKISSSNIEYYKKDNEGELEFLAYFYIGNEQFIVKSNLEINTFKEIIEKYIKVKML